jgi:hypothetical protein
MIRNLTSLRAAAAFALTALAPAPADARHRRDRDYGYDCRYDRDCGRYDRGRRHHNDDDDDAIAAGVVGLVLGVALGAMVSDANNRRQAPPPPQPRYEDRRGSAYERDYGYEDPYYDRTPQCTRAERQWDRYAQRYVTVDVPC